MSVERSVLEPSKTKKLFQSARKKDQEPTFGLFRNPETQKYATSPGHRKPIGRKCDPVEIAHLPLPETCVQKNKSANVDCCVFPKVRISPTSLSIFFVSRSEDIVRPT